MRPIHLLATCTLALSACAPVPPVTPVALGPVVMQQVTWRQNTPVFARVADGRACEAEALGLSAFAEEAEMMAAIAAISPAERDRRRDACMVGRGYSISRKAICQIGQGEGKQVYISSLTDALPPLASVECLVPGDGRPGTAGFILV